MPNTYQHIRYSHYVYHHNYHPYPSHQHYHSHYHHNYYQYDHHYHQYNHHHLGHHLKKLLEYCHSGNEAVFILTFAKLFAIKVPR